MYKYANWTNIRINIAAGIHSTTGSEFHLFHKYTKSWLLITDRQYSGWSLSGVLRAPSEIQGNREHREEHTCCLECCQYDNPRTCSEKKSNITTVRIVVTNDDRHVSRAVRTGTHTSLPRPESCGGSFPTKSKQSHTTKSRGCSQQVGTTS